MKLFFNKLLAQKNALRPTFHNEKKIHNLIKPNNEAFSGWKANHIFSQSEVFLPQLQK